MNWTQELSEKIIDALKQAVAKEQGRIDALPNLNSELRVGMHDYIGIEYSPFNAKIKVSLDDSQYGSPIIVLKDQRVEGDITAENIEQELIPLLNKQITNYLDSIQHLFIFTYKVKVESFFRIKIKTHQFTILNYVHSEKRKALQDKTENYLQENTTQQTTVIKPDDASTIVANLLDPDLFDTFQAKRIQNIFVSTLVNYKSNKKGRSEPLWSIIYHLKKWADNSFLPKYFHLGEHRFEDGYFTLKKDLDASTFQPDEFDLLIYTATLLIRHEPSYAKSTGTEYLEHAKELGNSSAIQMLKKGSGLLTDKVIHFQDENIECFAHDIYAKITITIKKECQESYQKALEFLCTLLKSHFPNSYEIKLKSKEKNYLSVKGLKKSQTHRFIANALQYQALHPLLAKYARMAMTENEWYNDVEAEHCCMPGTYVVFALGLSDQEYFPLVKEYMLKVDEEHQSVHHHFTLHFIEQHGINPESIPILVYCLLCDMDGKKIKGLDKKMETKENLACLIQSLQSIEDPEDFQVEHIAEFIWGSRKKMEKHAHTAAAEIQVCLNEILAMMEALL